MCPEQNIFLLLTLSYGVGIFPCGCPSTTLPSISPGSPHPVAGAHPSPKEDHPFPVPGGSHPSPGDDQLAPPTGSPRGDPDSSPSTRFGTGASGGMNPFDVASSSKSSNSTCGKRVPRGDQRFAPFENFCFVLVSEGADPNLRVWRRTHAIHLLRFVSLSLVLIRCQKADSFQRMRFMRKNVPLKQTLPHEQTGIKVHQLRSPFYAPILRTV